MISTRTTRLIARLKNDEAQVLPWMALLVVLSLGIGGLSVDLGHAYICQRELQASTDAAALAGGYAMAITGSTTTSVTTAAKAYSSLSTGNNANAGLPSVTFSDTFKCLNSLVKQGIACTGSPTGYNALQVTQTTTISTVFIRILNVLKGNAMSSLTLTTTSTAAMRGSINQQYNVAIVIDTTASMGQNDSDGNCNSTKIACALQGVQTLLQSLTPCTSSTGSCVGFDNVSLFTFPNVSASTAQNDYNCNGKQPTIVNYTTPTAGGTWSAPSGSTGTYQVTSFMDDYSSTDAAGGALSTSSDLVIAANGKSGCSGLQTPGGDGTYFAGAIYAALSALNAEQAANPGSLNALIILSDGDASSTKITANNGYTLTTTGKYPSAIDQCQQAVTAAQSASSSTTVYTVAYGAATSGGCSTDVPSISPCTTLLDMATSASDFYSDATTTNKGACQSASHPNLTLNQIFQAISVSGFTKSGLVSNDST